MKRKRVIIVGGGVIGAACAYYLAKDDFDVTILEQDRFGKGCSHGNCGLIALRHILPLNEPGAVRAALKTVFAANSPLRIRPGLNFGLWNWLLHFARRCNERDWMASAQALATLLRSSGKLYEQLFEEESMACEYEQRGCLLVYRTRETLEHYANTARLLRETFQVTSNRYDGNELVKLEPALKDGLAGGWHCCGDAHLRPDRLMSGWRGVLEKMNVTIRESAKVTGVRRSASGSRAVAVLLPEGEETADAFVFSAGAWTPFLNHHLGCRIPIQPGKGYSITMPRPQRCPKIPLLFQEHRVAVTPMQSGYRLGSMMEFVGYDRSLPAERLALLHGAARIYLHEPDTEPVEEKWYGWRPMTYDGKPIISRSPAMENVYIAAGHNMIGMTLAPATGKLIAELVGGRTPHIDPEPFSVERFSSIKAADK